jgi:hypothetical protein
MLSKWIWEEICKGETVFSLPLLFMVHHSNTDYDLQLYSRLYLSQDISVRSDLTIFDLVFFLILSSIMLTLFTYVLQKLLDEEIKRIEKQYEADLIKYDDIFRSGFSVYKSRIEVKNADTLA